MLQIMMTLSGILTSVRVRAGGEHQASSVYFFSRIILETGVEAGEPCCLEQNIPL